MQAGCRLQLLMRKQGAGWGCRGGRRTWHTRPLLLHRLLHTLAHERQARKVQLGVLAVKGPGGEEEALALRAGGCPSAGGVNGLAWQRAGLGRGGPDCSWWGVPGGRPRAGCCTPHLVNMWHCWPLQAGGGCIGHVGVGWHGQQVIVAGPAATRRARGAVWAHRAWAAKRGCTPPASAHARDAALGLCCFGSHVLLRDLLTTRASVRAAAGQVDLKRSACSRSGLLPSQPVLRAGPRAVSARRAGWPRPLGALSASR